MEVNGGILCPAGGDPRGPAQADGAGRTPPPPVGLQIPALDPRVPHHDPGRFGRLRPAVPAHGNPHPLAVPAHVSHRPRQDLHVQPGEVLVVIVRPNPQLAARVTGRDLRPRRRELGADHSGGVTAVHEAAGRQGRSGGTHKRRATIAVATAAVTVANAGAAFVAPVSRISRCRI